MSWDNLQAFFAMGGYATYVWGSYGIAVVCIGVELWLLRRRRRTLLRTLGRTSGGRGPA
jgi:heme exporter protein D